MTSVPARRPGWPGSGEAGAAADHPVARGRGRPADGGTGRPRRAGAPRRPDRSPRSPGRPGRPVPAWVRRTWVLPAAVVALAAVALVSAPGPSGPGPGEAEVTVRGSARVLRADGGARLVVDREVRVGPGDRVEVVTGSALFALAGAVTFEGRAGDGALPATVVEMAAVPELRAGRLLVVAPVEATVRALRSTVRVGPAPDRPGAARLDHGVGLGVGVYAGRAVVDSAARTATVPPFRRVEVAAPGLLGRGDLPLRYSGSDPWDRRFLGDALLVDRQLAPLLVGLAGAGVDLADPEVLGRALADPPAPPVLAALVDGTWPGGDVLLAAVLVPLVGAGPAGGDTFAATWRDVARLRAEGAPWGLVAAARAVDPTTFLDAVRAAVDRLAPEPGGEAEGTDPPEVAAPPVALPPPGSVPPPPPPSAPGPPPAVPAGPAGPGPAVPPPSSTPVVAPSPAPPGPASPPPPGVTPPLPPGGDGGSGGPGGTPGVGDALVTTLEQALDAVGGIVDGLLGGLLGGLGGGR